MGTAPPLSWVLTYAQASRLQEYVQTYRHQALGTVLPSQDRNMALRVLQVVQGKLIDGLDQNRLRFRLIVTQEEKAALQTMTITLLVLYSKEPETGSRNATIADLLALRTGLNNL